MSVPEGESASASKRKRANAKESERQTRDFAAHGFRVRLAAEDEHVGEDEEAAERVVKGQKCVRPVPMCARWQM